MGKKPHPAHLLTPITALQLLVQRTPSFCKVDNFLKMLSFTAVFAVLLPLAFAQSQCDVSKAQIPLPAGAAISVPAGQVPVFVTHGMGTQNYTCTNGVYASAGAVATLVDVSCTTGRASGGRRMEKRQRGRPSGGRGAVLGQHYFITSGTGIAPKFDFTSSGNGFVVVSKAGSITAPTGAQDVPWLQLTQTDGDLASTVFRVKTSLGQPPATCTTEGEQLEVAYQADYWFYE
ncbi:hypothetical protein BT69DRAFT_81938 [Atractiella rhizophila]|nr:hypothetical protein BT69DRAFT_81938 [Atractiella rhizophila]